jgi:3-oxoadipate enol-lactonase
MSPIGNAAVENGTLWYEAAGEGPAVILIHPGLWDARAWDAQFEPFAERYAVLRYDVRGYGRSSRPDPAVPYSHVRDLMAVMEASGIERGAIVGCSLGGAIALDVALSHPGMVTALVLAAPRVGGVEGTPEDEAWFEERLSGLEEAIALGDLERARRMQLRIWAPLGIDDPNGRRIFELSMDNIHELTMDESGAEDLDPPAAVRLAEIDVPTLVLPADHDPPLFQRMSATVANGIPGARVVHLPDVDHAIPMRAPDAFNEAVLAFLDEVL